MNNRVYIIDRAPGFSVANARVFAEIAGRAYDEHTHRDPVTGTDVLVIEQTDCVIVAFRGTSEIKDWIIDADFKKVYMGADREVHAGFARAWAAICPKLKPLTTDKRPFYFVGHSLGGALAQLGALGFYERNCLIGGVYTFGSPRLFNGVGATAYNFFLKKSTFNLVNACDPVPLLPPLTLGYRDNGTEEFMPPAGDFVPDPFIGWEIIDDLMGMLRSWRAGKLAFLPNHFIKRYGQRVSAP